MEELRKERREGGRDGWNEEGGKREGRMKGREGESGKAESRTGATRVWKNRIPRLVQL